MKKSLPLVLALVIAAGCLCIAASAGADTETWFVKTGDGKGLNVRDIESGQKIGSLPYGSAVQVEWFSGEWAIIYWTDSSNAKVAKKFLIAYYPGK